MEDIQIYIKIFLRNTISIRVIDIKGHYKSGSVDPIFKLLCPKHVQLHGLRLVDLVDQKRTDNSTIVVTSTVPVLTLSVIKLSFLATSLEHCR